MSLCGFLSRCQERSPHTDSRALHRIALAMTHLERNFAQPVTVDGLAAIARLSRRSFLRAFEAATGSAPIAYLIRLRVHHAAALLRHGDETVTEIAFRCGFGDSNYLARQFKAAFGLTPLEYRRRHGKGR
jgi:transcriptional regulator GlxA family with amidase domain